ncbi:MAG: c-type cytochrome [Anaerolineaceae bacterium]|nr:c-type cytochrome [Anaerolineaceae bacterium]
MNMQNRRRPLSYRFVVGLLLAVMVTSGSFWVLAQGETSADACEPDNLALQIESLQAALPADFEGDTDLALGNLFRLANIYQQLAINCGYEPTELEINALIGNTLSLADVGTILAANAVGDDMDAVLADLDSVTGDSFTGQLLYNGMEPALDGSALGCSGCHEGEAAPPTEGTWTRVDEERLVLSQFEDYSDVHYLVESILHPNDYIVEGYTANLMPTNFGQRMDVQQLADLVAYLMSQDQLPEDTE